MSQTQGLDRFCDSLRLAMVDGVRPPRLDGTVMATSGTDVAQDEKRGGAGVPAFPPVRAARFFADGMELEPVHRLFDLEIVRTGLGFHLEPGRKSSRRADG